MIETCVFAAWVQLYSSKYILNNKKHLDLIVSVAQPLVKRVFLVERLSRGAGSETPPSGFNSPLRPPQRDSDPLWTEHFKDVFQEMHRSASGLVMKVDKPLLFSKAAFMRLQYC